MLFQLNTRSAKYYVLDFSFQIKAIQRMPKADREEMLRILKKVDDTLNKNWQGYEGFEELQEKCSRLRTILEEAVDSDETGKGL